MSQRLGIRHFLLWMLGCALVMGLLNLIHAVNLTPTAERDVLSNLVGGIAYGTALAGLFFGIASWRQGRSVITHPGHLLLLLAAVAALLDLGLTLLFSVMAQQYHHKEWWSVYYFHRQAIGHGVGAVVLVVSLVKMPFGNMWRIVLIPLLLLSLLQSLWHGCVLFNAGRQLQALFGPNWFRFQNDSFNVLTMVGAAILSIVAIVDWAVFRAKRDWLHWVGVCAWLGLASTHVASAAIRYFR